MDTSTVGHGMTMNVAPEFGAWPVEGSAVGITNEIRAKFDELLTLIAGGIPSTNQRYLALVKTNLEQACFYAIKGVAKPVGGGN